MATFVITSLEQQLDNSGAVLGGGFIYVYQPTTTTLVSLYSNTGLSASVSNPITLDSAGRHAITYLANGAYKIVCKDSASVTLWTRDNIDPGIPIGTGALAIANGGTAATTASAALANLGGVTAAEAADMAADIAALAGTLGSTDVTHLATGTTAQRPASPAQGDVRCNSDLTQFEGYIAAWSKFIRASDIATQPTVQRFTSGVTQTYTTPANVVRLEVEMVGPGGGGGAVATNAGANGSADTLFALWTAVKGNGGAANGGTPGIGGTGGTDSTGTKIYRIDGQNGALGQTAGAAGVNPANAGGGSSFFGGGGQNAATSATGGTAKANSGSGGAGGISGANSTAGSGGGAGEYVKFQINAPSATYTYTVGSGGAGGTAGTFAGGVGAAGLIVVREFYS